MSERKRMVPSLSKSALSLSQKVLCDWFLARCSLRFSFWYLDFFDVSDFAGGLFFLAFQLARCVWAVSLLTLSAWLFVLSRFFLSGFLLLFLSLILVSSFFC